MNREKLQAELEAMGLTEPRITVEHVESKIKDVAFHVFEGSCLTVCCLTLENGFTVTGECACVSPGNFNKEIGEKVSLAKAKDKIHALEAYLLKEAIYRSTK